MPRWRLAGGQHGGSREAAGVGVELFPYEGKLPAHAIWFGEDQGRYVVEVTPAKAEEVVERARLLQLPARIVGRTVLAEAASDPHDDAAGATGSHNTATRASSTYAGAPRAPAPPPSIALKGETALPLAELRQVHEGWMKGLMAAELGV